MAPSAVNMTSNTVTPQNRETVPVIDFSPFRKEKSLEKAKELFTAFQDSGFVYIQNHGVPQKVVDEAFTWVRQVQPT
jgi:isopenicillin N synthase-like dioxygenase